jgi:glycosyltransferase involved in cell wall biosynthesis
MRIVHVDSAASWRGGQNQVLLSACGMVERGHTVTLACRRDGALETRARAAGLHVYPLRVHGDFSLTAAAGLARLQRSQRPHVVHAHDPHAISAAALAALVAPAERCVATRRVDFPLHGAPSRWKYRRFARVVAVSHAIANVLARSGLDRQRLRVVYEGVAVRPPQPGGLEALRALGVPEQSLVVGNIAALTDHKDHATLIDAAAQVVARVPRARFLVLGEGECRAALETRIHERGLTGKFVLAGFRRDVDALLPTFALFCLSSHMEGLGTSLLDAMMYGVPVVATAAGGIPEAVEDGVTGRLVPPRQPERLAEALVELLHDEQRRHAWGRAGRRRFEERFTASRMIEETLRIYEEVP